MVLGIFCVSFFTIKFIEQSKSVMIYSRSKKFVNIKLFHGTGTKCSEHLTLLPILEQGCCLADLDLHGSALFWMLDLDPFTFK
jgi:hypothetical protein